MHRLPIATFEPLLLTYILNSLWQLPLIFVAAWIAARFSRRAGPAFQHALWTGALLTEIILPAISANPSQMLRCAFRWIAFFRSAHPLTENITVTTSSPHAAASDFHLSPLLLAVAALLYLAGFVFFAIRLVIGLVQTSALRRRALPMDLGGHARESAHRYAQLFAVPHARIAVSSAIGGPITLGIRRPVLLLPAHLDATLPAEDLDAVLAHEFAHMRRRDFAKNLLYQLLSLPIAFHPVAWLTRSRVSETRELICDDLAANAVEGRRRYARSLLRLAAQFAARPHVTPTPHAIGIFDTHPARNFERRIMNLTHHSIELRGAARFVPTALSIMLIAGACTAALAYRQQVAAPQTQETAQSPAATSASTATQSPSAPSSFTLAIPRSADGKPAANFAIETQTASVADPSPKKVMFLKLLTPPVIGADQTSAQGGLKVSTNDMAGNRVGYVNPIYPPEAKEKKLTGTVILNATIGKDGTIQSLVVVSGPEIFQKSAIDAVHQWTYKPYLLNGDPVAVETTITVNYALAN